MKNKNLRNLAFKNLRNRRQRRGFTLMEILIAMSIFMVIVALVGTVFIKSLHYFGDSQDSVQSFGAVKRASMAFSEDISSMLVIAESAIEERDAFSGTEDMLIFLYPSDEGVKEIAYFYDSEAQEVVKYYSDNDYDFSSYDNKSVIARNVIECSFSYYYQESWVEALNNQFPSAVKVQMKIVNGRNQQEINEIFNIPTVN